MTKRPSSRPKADGKSPIGLQRYALLKAAFQHAQRAIEEERYLEAIPVLESIILDRLSSLVGGSLNHDIDLKWTIGRIHELATKNAVRPNGGPGRGTKTRLPADIVSFIDKDVRGWFDLRNHAIHGMAKLRRVGDDTFAQRYAKLGAVALTGVRVLLQLDRFDARQKEANRAGLSATFPDALGLTPQVESLLSGQTNVPTKPTSLLT